MGKKNKRKKTKNQTQSSKKSTKQNKQTHSDNTASNKNTLLIAVVVLLGGLFLGVQVIPAFKDSTSAPATKSAPMKQVTGGKAGQIEQIKSQLISQPNSAGLWTTLGNLYFDTGQNLLAIDAYTKSLEIAPGNPNVLTDLGVMYRRANQPLVAIETFNRAIKADPTHQTARMNKGIVYFYDLQDKDAALEAWNALLEVNPLARTSQGGLVKDMVKNLFP
ncbi:MAG: tetratricopeptide repeat protein [Desulfovibrio sp.]